MSLPQANKELPPKTLRAHRRAGTLRLLRRYEELHEGVVKCARWRDAGSTFASCGNDRCGRLGAKV